MKILFAPSEIKRYGGEFDNIDKSNFNFNDFFEIRSFAIKKYENFIKISSDESLKSLFGTKKLSLVHTYKDIKIFSSHTMKAINRYNGVAFEYLNYNTLNEKEKSFLENNLIIFSNLFGPLLASEAIPYYKLKQGEKLAEFIPEKYYKEQTTLKMNKYLENEFIIDLRAGFYDKFYKINKPYVTMKFIKNGKVVSHWAKAYRGKALRELAKYQPQNEQEFSKIYFEGLHIKEIIEKGFKKEYVYEIHSS
jgi:cytoplasmic iron level regulating protein YaaA (DUF328/UPF0246 family)